MVRLRWSVCVPVLVALVLVSGVVTGNAQTSGQAPGASSAAAGRMIKPNQLIHVVASLEKSVGFYRDAIGFELVSGPEPLTGSALLQQAVAASPKAKARAATFRIPGSEMQFMLIEFSGIEGKAFSQQLYDPGITRFSIQVRDIDAAFARVKDRVVVNSTGGAPVFTQKPRNNTRAVMMHDPDGFVFEFVQADPLPETSVPKSSNVYNARSSLAIEDTAKSLAFYRDVLGYEARPQNTVNDAVLALEGTPTAVAKTTSTSPPGSTNVWFFWEFSNIARTKHEARVQDPGASALSLLVENLPALLVRVKAAGTKVETVGGDVVPLGPARRGVLVRSPDGLLVELVEQMR